MNRRIRIYVAMFFTSAKICFASDIGPDEILSKADQVRNPKESFEMTVRVVTSGEEDSRFYVLVKGREKTLIETREPKRDVGRDLLMVEDNMWAFIPRLKRWIRVSMSQKLSGSAANGDISRMRWSGDYEASIEKDDPKHWDLLLKARRKGLTYEAMRVSIAKGTFYPIKATYLTKQLKPLKEATFSEYVQLAGAIRPSKIEIRDANVSSKVSKILIESMSKVDIPDSKFTLNRFGAR